MQPRSHGAAEKNFLLCVSTPPRPYSPAFLETERQPRAEGVGQTLDPLDLSGRRAVVVTDAAERDGLPVEDHVARADVAVPRLADGADVHEELAPDDGVGDFDVALVEER